MAVQIWWATLKGKCVEGRLSMLHQPCGTKSNEELLGCLGLYAMSATTAIFMARSCETLKSSPIWWLLWRVHTPTWLLMGNVLNSATETILNIPMEPTKREVCQEYCDWDWLKLWVLNIGILIRHLCVFNAHSARSNHVVPLGETYGYVFIRFIHRLLFLSVSALLVLVRGTSLHFGQLVNYRHRWSILINDWSVDAVMTSSLVK